MIDIDNYEGEVLELEPYTEAPDWDGPVGDDDGNQDVVDPDEEENQIVGFLGRAAPSSTRSWKETLEWYKNHTTARQIGFDPDAMCLMICRTARNIPARYPSAKVSQDATPTEHRITQIRNLRRAMIAYFDDPNDSNRFGHIVTVAGRVKGFDKDDLNDVLFWTNSVKEDSLVLVRGDYFITHWGDSFKFGATWLNGVELDLPNHGTKVERFHDTKPEYDLGILERAGKDRPHARHVLNQIRSQVNQLPDSPKMERVAAFKRQVRADNVLDIRILDRAIEDGRQGLVRRVRNELKRLIESLPDE